MNLDTRYLEIHYQPTPLWIKFRLIEQNRKESFQQAQ